ncbi:hypothetical protein CVD25_00940 [Bacillus canaveralius]|uniref:rRNA biogenesis protein rrp5 n=1 Tax=Bacillus canaveralius TaxID=1403243 RepID=A0A2N5GPK5_9BACI|nr:hypothetical protein [Bacillus canaveralius]PLR84633.1 hypothetical protein CU635_06045 [Bacillus canaveralius]PLS00785.1 hypothetical protein CVD25_00940 [Bacillus canaveralius]
MNFTIEIKAPELAAAITALAEALSGSKLTPVQNGSPAQKNKGVNKEVEKEPETSNPDPVEAEATEEEEGESTISLETVREKLAALSQSGKQKQVKELISSFGVKKLTDVPAKHYAALLEKAEEL